MDRTSRGNAHSAPHVAKHGTVTMIKFVATVDNLTIQDLLFPEQRQVESGGRYKVFQFKNRTPSF